MARQTVSTQKGDGMMIRMILAERASARNYGSGPLRVHSRFKNSRSTAMRSLRRSPLSAAMRARSRLWAELETDESPDGQHQRKHSPLATKGRHEHAHDAGSQLSAKSGAVPQEEEKAPYQQVQERALAAKAVKVNLVVGQPFAERRSAGRHHGRCHRGTLGYAIRGVTDKCRQRVQSGGLSGQDAGPGRVQFP